MIDTQLTIIARKRFKIEPAGNNIQHSVDGSQYFASSDFKNINLMLAICWKILVWNKKSLI